MLRRQKNLKVPLSRKGAVQSCHPGLLAHAVLQLAVNLPLRTCALGTSCSGHSGHRYLNQALDIQRRCPYHAEPWIEHHWPQNTCLNILSNLDINASEGRKSIEFSYTMNILIRQWEVVSLEFVLSRVFFRQPAPKHEWKAQHLRSPNKIVVFLYLKPQILNQHKPTFPGAKTHVAGRAPGNSMVCQLSLSWTPSILSMPAACPHHSNPPWRFSTRAIQIHRVLWRIEE